MIIDYIAIQKQIIICSSYFNSVQLGRAGHRPYSGRALHGPQLISRVVKATAPTSSICFAYQ